MLTRAILVARSQAACSSSVSQTRNSARFFSFGVAKIVNSECPMKDHTKANAWCLNQSTEAGADLGKHESFAPSTEGVSVTASSVAGARGFLHLSLPQTPHVRVCLVSCSPSSIKVMQAILCESRVGVLVIPSLQLPHRASAIMNLSNAPIHRPASGKGPVGRL